MKRQASANETLLSIADISRHFSLPESTTRYYCKRFAAFIPSVGEGRRRRYRPETLDVITAILTEMQKSRTAAAVENALQANFASNAVAVSSAEACLPPVEETQSQFFPAAALQLLERQISALEGIANFMQVLVDRLPLETTPQAATSTDVHKEIETLRLLLTASEKNQQADLDQLRTWMTRVIRRQPAVQATA